MVRKLYPLNGLRAFEAAGRHLSFVKAADELHVTPGAISHQIKGLEEFLDVRLFRRRPQRVLLTDEGQAFLFELRTCFLKLDRAVERVLESDAPGMLSISVAPAFASKWLSPRLQRFSDGNPKIDLRISSSLATIDFQRDQFDAAIRLGRGSYAGLEAVKLFDEFATPMCSPRLLEDNNGLRTADDLQHHILLHDDSLDFDAAAPHWSDWLEAAGANKVDGNRGPHFSHPDHALQAAIDGAGVVLGWKSLALADLKAGRIVAPFELALPLGLDFYLVYPKGHGERSNVEAFKKWLLQELEHDQ